MQCKQAMKNLNPPPPHPDHYPSSLSCPPFAHLIDVFNDPTASPATNVREYDFLRCMEEQYSHVHSDHSQVDCSLYLGTSSAPTSHSRRTQELSCSESVAPPRSGLCSPSFLSGCSSFISQKSTKCVHLDLSYEEFDDMDDKLPETGSSLALTHWMEGFANSRDVSPSKIFHPFSRNRWIALAKEYHENAMTLLKDNGRSVSPTTSSDNNPQLLGAQNEGTRPKRRFDECWMENQLSHATDLQSTTFCQPPSIRTFSNSQISRKSIEELCLRDHRYRQDAAIAHFAVDSEGQKRALEERGSRGIMKLGCTDGLGYILRICAQCKTMKTPLWRNGPQGPKSLCNACGIRFKKEERRFAVANDSQRSFVNKACDSGGPVSVSAGDGDSPIHQGSEKRLSLQQLDVAGYVDEPVTAPAERNQIEKRPKLTDVLGTSTNLSTCVAMRKQLQVV